jgi:sigma-B regulation protein RsbU (phosphoserine phosphatase)
LDVRYDRLAALPTTGTQVAQGFEDDLLAVSERLWRTVLERDPASLWVWTALDTGPSWLYPAPDTDLDDLPDPRRTDWYRRAIKGEVMVSTTLSDPVTGQPSLLLALPVRGPGGEHLGVCAIVLSSARSLGAKTVSAPWADRLDVYQVVADERGLLVRSRLRADEPGDAWTMPGKRTYLTRRDTETGRELVRMVELGRSGVVEREQGGVASFVAVGAIEPGRSALVATVPLAAVQIRAEMTRGYIADAVDDQLIGLGTTFLLMALGVGVFSVLFARAMTTPLQKAVDAVRAVAAGDFTARIDFRTGDERQVLFDAFNDMVPRLEDQFRLKEAMDVAEKVHQHLLPRAAPGVPGFDLAALSMPCDEIGGDYYDFIWPDEDGPFTMAVGDAAGHGVGATLLMATARALLRGRVHQSGEPARMVSEVNRILTFDFFDAGRFMTLALLMVDPATRTLAWVHAGHEPILVYDPATDSFRELAGGGLPMGIDESWEYETQRIGLRPGEVILAATDGVMEAANPAGEMFGAERVRAFVRRHAAESATLIAEALAAEVIRFRADERQHDDMTVVVIKA